MRTTRELDMKTRRKKNKESEQVTPNVARLSHQFAGTKKESQPSQRPSMQTMKPL